MSGDDRALGGQRARVAERIAGAPEFIEPEDSMPVIVENHDDDTPVHAPQRRRRKRVTVQQFAEDIKTEVRDIRRAVEELTIAKLNMRAELIERLIAAETRLDGMDHLGESTDELRQLRVDLTELRVTLIGIDGTNGKVGGLVISVASAHEKAEKGPKFVRGAIMWAGGGILGALVPAILLLRDAADKSAEVRAAAASERATFQAEIEADKADRAVIHAEVDALLGLLRAPKNQGAPP